MSRRARNPIRDKHTLELAANVAEHARMTCPACGDRFNVTNETARKVGKQVYCKECGDELADGVIGKPPRPAFNGRPDPTDEGNEAWREFQ